MIAFYIDILNSHQEFISTMQRLEKFTKIKIRTIKDITSIRINQIVVIIVTNDIFNSQVAMNITDRRFGEYF